MTTQESIVSPGNYNLIVEPWSPVLCTNGKFTRVGIRDALTRSRSIRQIAASNPMDNVALLRFLLAVLYWCRASLADEERKGLNALQGIPEKWLTNLGKPTQPNGAFNLLGDGERFFQDKSMKNSKSCRPIGDLLVEFPTETGSSGGRSIFPTRVGVNR